MQNDSIQRIDAHLKHSAAMTSAVRNYDPYSTNRQLAAILRASLALDFADAEARKILNEYALANYQNESVIKYAMVGHILSREKRSEVSLFELPVGNNRVDLCRINGHSIAFEIKTEYDSLNRLDSQLTSYSKVFDYVYVVTPISRCYEIMPILPQSIGLLAYRATRAGFVFSYRKRAERQCPCFREQISSLPKRSLISIAHQLHLDKPQQLAQSSLDHCLQEWCESHPGKFNSFYKDELKKRYRDRWLFVRKEYPAILPLDIQSSFASQINLSASSF